MARVADIRGAGVSQSIYQCKFSKKNHCMSPGLFQKLILSRVLRCRASSTNAGNGFNFSASSNAAPGFTRLDDVKLAKAIVYEANRGFCDSTGSTKKFSDFLNSQLSIHAEKIKSHEPLQHLAQDAKLYGQMDHEQRVDLLDRVAQIQGFSSAKEIIEHEIAVAEASESQTPIESTEPVSIVYGSSERVEIFNFESRTPPLANRSSGSTTTPATSKQNDQLVSDSQCSTPAPSSFQQQEKPDAPLQKINEYHGDWTLDTPLSQLKCFTAYQKTQLQENGFYMARSLLNHFPRAHISFQSPTKDLEEGQFIALIGTIVQKNISQIKKGLSLVEVILNCTIGQGCESEKTIFLHFKRFYQGQRFTENHFLAKITANYSEGSKAAVRGKVKAMNIKNHFEIRDCYEFKVVDEDIEKLQNECEAYPVYPSKGVLHSTKLKSFIHRMLAGLPSNLDPLPPELREKYNLLSLEEAYVGVHYPSTLKDATLARRRIVFDDYFYLQLAFLLQREGLLSSSGLLELEKWSPLCLKILNSLPFKLTNGQLRAVSEIMWDLRQPAPMSRLLQGEVGCGKTIVAFLVLLDVVQSGYQVALMTPTEFVATQHYKLFQSWLEFLDVEERPKIALLSAGISNVESRLIREGIANEEIAFVIGTHSLISRTTKFPALGLAVIDEQHRFGVLQRELLKTSHGSDMKPVEINSDEGRVKVTSTPHVLLLSATPIPRSMALSVHGDLSLSRISETPPGRQPTQTIVLSDDTGRKTAYELVRKELEQGGRAFFVYPLITEANARGCQRSATADFKKVVEEFTGYKCALVHGRMKPDAKQEAMRKFREGECQILVSTKIVEVGIDISEATVMLIENAEAYGISQLHQLRGRVGRGKKQSICILLSSCEAAMERLRLLQCTTDGFSLAEADLEMRGPGDLLGKRQSGNHVEFVLAKLGEDDDILEQAKSAAMELLESSRDLVPRLKQEINVRQLPKSWS